MKETRVTLTADQIQFPPRTAQILRSPASHEVVYGTTGSGKTTLVKKLLADDKANGRKVWVIDPTGGMSLPDWDGKADRFAKEVDEAEALLTDLVELVRYDGWSAPPRTLTIEHAANVLDDRACRRLVEKILDEARVGSVGVRVVVNTLHLTSFGGSKVIRSALTSGAEAVE